VAEGGDVELSGATNSSGSGKIKVDKRAKLHFVKHALKKLVEHFFLVAMAWSPRARCLLRERLKLIFAGKADFRLSEERQSTIYEAAERPFPKAPYWRRRAEERRRGANGRGS
jgi:hypothetical protein